MYNIIIGIDYGRGGILNTGPSAAPPSRDYSKAVPGPNVHIPTWRVVILEPDTNVYRIVYNGTDQVLALKIQNSYTSLGYQTQILNESESLPFASTNTSCYEVVYYYNKQDNFVRFVTWNQAWDFVYRIAYYEKYPPEIWNVCGSDRTLLYRKE